MDLAIKVVRGLLISQEDYNLALGVEFCGSNPGAQVSVSTQHLMVSDVASDVKDRYLEDDRDIALFKKVMKSNRYFHTRN